MSVPSDPNFPSVVSSPGVLKFPLGEDYFSVARVAYALWARQHHNDVHAFSKYAPKEKKHYDALKAYSDGASMNDYIGGRTNVKVNQIATGQDGGFLAPERFEQDFYGILRGKSVLRSLPITYLPTDARMAHSAKMTADFTEAYFSESATITTSTLSFGQDSFQPRKQAILVKLSREMVRDSAPAADQIIIDQGAEFMARGRDKQMLLGNGQSGAPTGLINMTNVTVTSLAATPTYANVVAGINNVRQANLTSNVTASQADCTGVVYHTQFESTVASMLDSNSHSLWPFGLQTGLASLNFLAVPNWVGTNVIPSGNSASVFYGDWKYLIQRYRPDIEFALATELESAFVLDEIWLRLIARYDVACAHPEAFFVHSNAHA